MEGVMGMDALRANFPHLVPREKEEHVDWIKEPVVFGGDRGLCKGETLREENFKPCDGLYLASVIAQVDRAIIFIHRYYEPVIQGQEGEQASQLVYAARIMRMVNWELKRLEDNKALYNGDSVRNRFWIVMNRILDSARHLLKFAAKYGAKFYRALKAFDEAQKLLLVPIAPPAADAGPVQEWLHPGTGEALPLWFHAGMPREGAAGISEILFPTFKKQAGVAPDAEILRTQFLPPHGLLIAEHWRKQQESWVKRIMAKSKDPSVIETQMPAFKDMVTGSSKSSAGTDVLQLMRAKMPAYHSTAPKNSVADCARFMAELDGELDFVADGAEGSGVGRILYSNV